MRSGFDIDKRMFAGARFLLRGDDAELTTYGFGVSRGAEERNGGPSPCSDQHSVVRVRQGIRRGVVLGSEPMVAASTSRPKLTHESWAALAEDEPGELVDGVLEEEEMPSFIHEVVVIWIGAVLRAWAASRGGFVAGSGLKLKVSPHRGRMADLVVYFRRGKVQARGLVTVPPDVVVEIVSPDPRDQRRDRIVKHDEYAAFGVSYYWLVSPELRSVEVLALGPDGKYVHAQNLTSGSAAIVGCDGLELDLDALWREVERAETEDSD